ncbi:MAG TPA: glycerol-3-phosphate 1-O-acyltransferase PlsY [Candidatus Tyrphobacter sp.]
MIFFLSFIVAFAVGSIPFGYLIGRFVYRVDIREHGSGNIGAMNALRALGKMGAAAVLLLDTVKGFAPAFSALALGYGDVAASLAAGGSVLGHCFSPWLRGRGGKGVATSFGAIVALNPYAGAIAILGWIAGALATQYSSVGSFFGSLLAPVALYIFSRGSLAETVYGLFALAVILYTHRENVLRLRNGSENPISISPRHKRE